MTYIMPDAMKYSYTMIGDVVEVLDPDGNHVIKAVSKPRRFDTWTVTDKEAWAMSEIAFRHRADVYNLIREKLDELNTVYDRYMVGRVILTDGTIFSASSLPGDNPNKSLHNTVRMIQDSADLSTYHTNLLPTITLSDAFNKDVIYTFDYDSDNPAIIPPILEIGMMIGRYFGVKRELRNMINAWADETVEFNYIVADGLDIAAMFGALSRVNPDGTPYTE